VIVQERICFFLGAFPKLYRVGRFRLLAIDIPLISPSTSTHPRTRSSLVAKIP
jgi:hypothetical protein